MRKLKTFLVLGFIAGGLGLAGCNQKENKEKITDIPVSSKSQEAVTAFRSGLVLLDQGNATKARIFFTTAIEKDTQLAIAYLFRSNTAATPKEYADDIEKAKNNLEGVSEWEKLYYEYANTFLTNNWDKRLEITQKIASTYPDAARAQVDLGTTYEGGMQFSKARDAFHKAVKVDSNWVGGYNALVGSYLFDEPKDFKKAEENGLKAVALNPSNSGAHIALGDCYRAQNNMEKARDAYAKAIAVSPDDPAGYYKKGHADTYLGQYEEARVDYMNAGKRDNVKTGSILNIANTYLYAGDSKTAMQYLADQAMKLDSSGDAKDKITIAKISCLDNGSRIAFHTHDVNTLKTLVDKMEPFSNEIANDINTDEARRTEKGSMLYWHALLSASEGNYDTARARAEQIKAVLDPVKDPMKLDGYHFVYGVIAMKQKNYSDAVSHFEKTNQSLIYNKYWLAVANEAAGNKDKAASLYKEVADYNFNDVGYALVRSEVKKKAGAPMAMK